MTQPSNATIEREKDKLYVTDAEMIRRIGVPEKKFRLKLIALESKWGFPKKSPFFEGRRYWPAVKNWFDRHEGITMGAPKGRRP